ARASAPVRSSSRSPRTRPGTSTRRSTSRWRPPSIQRGRSMAELAVLVTCPPMLASAAHWKGRFEALGIEVGLPAVVQQLSAAELIELLPGYDGMIAGD